MKHMRLRRHVDEDTFSTTVNRGCMPILLGALPTSIIGYEIHGSLGWAIVDFLVWPFCWVKWMICHEVNISIIKSAFNFFLQ